ncbi:hypothetical protein D9M72_464170 [compost metagenome]
MGETTSGHDAVERNGPEGCNQLQRLARRQTVNGIHDGLERVATTAQQRPDIEFIGILAHGNLREEWMAKTGLVEQVHQAIEVQPER